MLLFGSAHGVTSARISRVSAQPRLLLIGFLVALSSITALAQVAPVFSVAAKPIGNDDVKDFAGPAIVNFLGKNEIFYANHINDHLIFGIAPDAGTTGNANDNPDTTPVDTGIVMSGLGEVKATVLGSTLYVSYIDQGGVAALATSTNGTSFTTLIPEYSATVNTAYVPTIFAFNGELWAAFVTNVGTDEAVFDVSSDGGAVFTQQNVVTTTDPPVSTISLADFNGVLYAAYVIAPSTPAQPVFGSVLQGQASSIPFALVSENACCHNSTSASNGEPLFTGVTLIGVPGEGLYLFTQSPASEDTFFYSATSDPKTVPFPAAVQVGSQSFRWDLGAVLESDNTLAIAYQQSSATQMDFTSMTF